jgi:hypothetical protein
MGSDRNRLRPTTRSHGKKSQPTNKNSQMNDSPDNRSKAHKKSDKPRPTPQRAYKGAIKTSTEGSFNDITAAEVLASMHTSPKDPPMTASTFSFDSGLEQDENTSMSPGGKDISVEGVHHGSVEGWIYDSESDSGERLKMEVANDEDELSSDRDLGTWFSETSHCLVG